MKADADVQARAGSLLDKYQVPPFSVLDTRQGYWQEARRSWLALGIRSELGRGVDADQAHDSGFTASGDSAVTRKFGSNVLTVDGDSRGLVGQMADQMKARRMRTAALTDTSLQQQANMRVAAFKVGDAGYFASRGSAKRSFEPTRAAWEGEPLTPIERHGRYWVKRDDTYEAAGVRGGKVRTCMALALAAQQAGAVGLVTAGSRSSPQVNIVAHVGRQLGMPVRAHVPSGELSPELIAARDAGAEIIQHQPGYNTVIVARARDDAAASGWALIPFGMECDEAVTQTSGQVGDLPDGCRRIVVPVGSGMTLAGVLAGLPIDAGGRHLPVVGVVVGADPTARLDAFAPGWRGDKDVTLVQADSDYATPATDTTLGDLQLDAHYEAKCLPYLQDDDLLWVVGIRQSADPRPAAPPPPPPGTSIFDPVLCELAYRWWCPPDGVILDPFAGGSVRGIVAGWLGHQYVGVDLSAPQVASNREQAEAIVDGAAGRIMPTWHVGDSATIVPTLGTEWADFVWTCPPYFDLEVYSDDAADLSAMPSWPAFFEAYQSIIGAALASLKRDRFAAIVVSEIRGPDGTFRGLVPATIRAFEMHGARYYNEAILVNPAGTLPMRVGRQFDAGRKLGRSHQNVLVFVKGAVPKTHEWGYAGTRAPDPQLELFDMPATGADGRVEA